MLTSKQAQFIGLLFNPDEEVCVAPDKWSYHSVTQKELNADKISLIQPNPKFGPKKIDSSQINFIALNPIRGFRRAENVLSFRTFLLEFDNGTPQEQYAEIQASGVPYSALVWSGGKSLHCFITLERELIAPQNYVAKMYADDPDPTLDIEYYKNTAKWLVHCFKDSDKVVTDPTRFARFPDNLRTYTPDELAQARKKNPDLMIKQSLIEIKTRVKNEDFFDFLKQNPDAKPAERLARNPSGATMDRLSANTLRFLKEGAPSGFFNTELFKAACNLARCGYDEDVIRELCTQVTGYLDKNDKKAIDSALRTTGRK